MSETTTEAPQEAPAEEATPAVEPQATQETPPATEASEASPEAIAEEIAKSPEPLNKRIAKLSARLTGKISEERARAEELERKLAAAQALLQQQHADEAPTPQAVTPADIDARAAQLVEAREFHRKLTDIDSTGRKEFGADAWEQAKQIMTGMGAVGNQAFLAALAETENPAKVFAALAEDTEELSSLLSKPPAAMAARLGRMDVKLSQPAAPVKPTSNAPRPPSPVATSSAPATPSLYDPKLSMDDFVAQFRKEFPNSKLRI